MISMLVFFVALLLVGNFSGVAGYCEGTLKITLPTATNITYSESTSNREIQINCNNVTEPDGAIVLMRVRGNFLVDVLCVDGNAYLPLRRTGSRGNFAKAGNVETSVFFFLFFFFIFFFFFFFFFFFLLTSTTLISTVFVLVVFRYYCALRFDPQTLLVDVGDQRFATTLVSNTLM
jgi:hypothetical protein